MSTEREALIEKAAKAIFELNPAPNAWTAWEDRVELERTHRRDKSWSGPVERAREHAAAAFAVFEKAQAPTDDEREALSNFLFTVYEHGSQPNALREADAILSFLASRRPAQGEPTDAQVIAALNAWHQDVMPVNRLGVFGTWKEDRMRAALRAAANVSEPGVTYISPRQMSAEPTAAQIERATKSVAEWNISDVPLELCRLIAVEALRAAFKEETQP